MSIDRYNESEYTQHDYFQDCLKDFVTPKGWRNESYINDASPSFSYGKFQIFVQHPLEMERETDYKRFVICDIETQEFIIDYDNLDDVENFLTDLWLQHFTIKESK